MPLASLPLLIASGWKAGAWEVLRRGVAGGALALAVADADPARAGNEILLRYADRTLLLRRAGPGTFDAGAPFDGPFPERAVVAFRSNGPTHELNLFHTGWFAPSGLTTAWRTRQVGNRALDDGWLTCLLYDEWTLTRVGVAFAQGPQGAVYAYRWDPVDHGEMTVNMLQTAHNGWGIRHSILFMRPE